MKRKFGLILGVNCNCHDLRLSKPVKEKQIGTLHSLSIDTVCNILLLLDSRIHKIGTLRIVHWVWLTVSACILLLRSRIINKDERIKSRHNHTWHRSLPRTAYQQTQQVLKISYIVVKYIQQYENNLWVRAMLKYSVVQTTAQNTRIVRCVDYGSKMYQVLLQQDWNLLDLFSSILVLHWPLPHIPNLFQFIVNCEILYVPFSTCGAMQDGESRGSHLGITWLLCALRHENHGLWRFPQAGVQISTLEMAEKQTLCCLRRLGCKTTEKALISLEDKEEVILGKSLNIY